MVLGRNRFEGAVVVSLTDDPAETDWLLDIAGQQEWIKAVLTRVTAPREWDRWQTHPKFRGVEGGLGGTMAELAARGLVAVLPPAAALQVMPAHPVAVNILDGVQFEPAAFDVWARMIEPLRQTAALARIDGLLNFIGPHGWRAETRRPWVQHVLQTFGAGRVMWGSGWPLSMPDATWKESLACFTQAMGPRAMEDRALILGENAIGFFETGAGFGYTEVSIR